MKVVSSASQEQLEFVYNYERNFVMPLKLAMIIIVTVLTYLLNTRGVFTDPRFYDGYIVAVVVAFCFLYYFYKPRQNLEYLKTVSFLSFAHDIAFISYFLQFTGGEKSPLQLAFAMYFVRAAISYPTISEMLFSGLAIFTPIYLVGLYSAEGGMHFLATKEFYTQYGFLWGIIISCFGVVNLLNRQKEKIQKNLREINSLQQQLIQAEKLAGLGQLAGGVAHELNNPLGSILGFAQMLLKEAPPEDPKYRDITKIEKASLRCKKIIDSLLSFSRQFKMEADFIHVHRAIEDTLALCQYEMEKCGIEKELSFDPHVPATYADLGQIQQVFMNLFLNAMDAMSKGGKLTIKTELLRERGQETIVISVKDTGRGIPPEHLNKIFDPFFTTKEIGKGTGLGLSIVYGIVQRHQGHIQVFSEPGVRTEFVIHLPVLKEKIEEPEQAYA